MSAERTAMITRRLSTLILLWLLGAPASSLAQPTVVEYYHTDALGSVRAVTDAGGTLLRQHDYWAFGVEVSPPPGECMSVQDPHGFTGQERDKETCQDYFGGRYYRANLGRFTSIDPVLDVGAAIVDPQRWNRYAYVSNNPLRYTDPDGRDPLLVTGAIGAVVYGGWNAVLNVQQGRPWYENVGVEASKGFLVGATLGLAAPALSASATAMATSAAVSGSGVASSLTVRFGANANQSSHAFRHLAKEGFDLSAVSTAVSTHLSAAGSSMSIGQTQSFTITVGGRAITYVAHRLSQEVFNVGRITPG